MIAPSREVRFGILGQGRTFPAWQARCIEELLRLPGVRHALLVVPDESHPSRRIETPRTAPLLFQAYSDLVRPRAFRPVDMHETSARVPSLKYRLRTEDGSSPAYDESDTGRIREHDLDFMLHFASGVVPRELLDTARYGVWSFHFDDDERYRGPQPCFWEVYHGDSVNGALLQRLTSRADARIVLRRGFFRTALHSLRHNIDEVHFGAAAWAANVCKDILAGHTSYIEGPPSLASAPILAAPTNSEMVRLLTRQTRKAVRRVGRGLLRHEEWCIGIVERPIASFLEPHDSMPVRWFRPPREGRFLADPFGVEIDGVLHILYEDFRYRTSKGVIATILASDSGPASPPTVALELPVHASYPYLFMDRGEIFCVPETHEARAVGLYRALDFPTRWEKAATILRGPAALDATVFRHEGRWWLTYTDLDAGQYVHLFVWHAQDLEGPWEPHALNPVKSDVRSARPAGTPFVHAGNLYRPAQDCSRTYGGRITVNRIRRLTPDQFAEEPAAVIEPFSDGPFPDGIHTISAVGDVTLIDGKRHRFIPSAIPYVIRSSRSEPGA